VSIATAPIARDGDDIGSTGFMSTLDIDDAPATPFEANAQVTPFSGNAPPPDAAVKDLAPHPSVGQTTGVDLSALADVFAAADAEDARAEAEPAGEAPAAASQASPDQAAAEHYAAVVANTEGLPPDQAEGMNRRYGLANVAARSALDSEMAAKLSADAALRQHFNATLARWRAWLQQQRQG
jgi:hypothetical protein